MTITMNYYDNHGGVEADQAVRKYASEHRVSYRDALYALNREGKTAERELAKEFARRVPAYMEEFNIKTYSEAAKRVAQHNDSMAHYYDSVVGDTLNRAKRA